MSPTWRRWCSRIACIRCPSARAVRTSARSSRAWWEISRRVSASSSGLPRPGLNTKETVEAFNDAFGRHDVDAVMALMTDDCLFENTLPPPDGERHVGPDEVRRFWQEFFDGTPQARFETEEMVVAGDRAVVRGRVDWGSGHVRGIDLFKVRDGKVAEKLSYVKG